jgi:hypothetical protein
MASRHRMTAVWHVVLLGVCACGGGRDGRTPGDAGMTSPDGAPAGMDGSMASDGSTPPSTLGNPEPGLVDCAGVTCDTSAGEACCLYFDERDPPGGLRGCVTDCATRSRPSLPATVIDCDGSEDCAGNACCNGQCSDAEQCSSGQREWCHDSTSCPAPTSCCTELRNGWGGSYGACSEPPAAGCGS